MESTIHLSVYFSSSNGNGKSLFFSLIGGILGTALGAFNTPFSLFECLAEG
jgi:hypothetical protein